MPASEQGKRIRTPWVSGGADTTAPATARNPVRRRLGRGVREAVNHDATADGAKDTNRLPPEISRRVPAIRFDVTL